MENWQNLKKGDIIDKEGRCDGCERKYRLGVKFWAMAGIFFCEMGCFNIATGNKYLDYERTPTGRIKITNGHNHPITNGEHPELINEPLWLVKCTTA